jgi:hexosaminidase
MALVAPLDKIEGGVDGLVLEAGVGLKESGRGNGGSTAPPVNNAGRRLERYGLGAWVLVGSSVLIFVFL